LINAPCLERFDYLFIVFSIRRRKDFYTILSNFPTSYYSWGWLVITVSVWVYKTSYATPLDDSNNEQTAVSKGITNLVFSPQTVSIKMKAIAAYPAGITSIEPIADVRYIMSFDPTALFRIHKSRLVKFDIRPP